MNRFMDGDELWPDGWTKLQVYFVPDPAEIKPLAEAYRGVLEGFDFLAPVPDHWLHATIHVLDDRAARSVTRGLRSALETRLRQELSQIPPFSVCAGPALASSAGVLLDLFPDDGFVDLVNRSARLIRGLFGDAAAKGPNGPVHIALAYATGSADSGIVQSRLRRIRPGRVNLTVSDVRLVDVTQDPAQDQYRWEERARIPLGV